jgi:hypothetical protein
MDIEIEFGAVAQLDSIRVVPPENGDSNDFFAELLNQQVNKTESHPIGQENEKASKFDEDIAIIKEKGMTAYLKELDARKREEIRAEILEAMGITEEDLANMSQKQMAGIEKMIAEEIQKRFAAMAMMDKKDEGSSVQPPVETIMPGKGGGFAFLSAIEEAGNPDPFEILPEDQDRESLQNYLI